MHRVPAVFDGNRFPGAFRFAILVAALPFTLCRIGSASSLVLDPAIDASVLSASAAEVTGVGLQSDGRIIIAGNFTHVDGIAVSGIARLNADGSRDPDFAPVNVEGVVSAVAVAPNDSIYIAGFFSGVNGSARSGVARLQKDGQLDAAFHPVPSHQILRVISVSVTSDGGLYLAASGSGSASGTSGVSVDRFTTGGAAAPGFTPLFLDGAFAEDVAFGPGDTFVVLSFRNGQNAFNETVRRFLATGLPDTLFTPPADYPLSVHAAWMDSDGSVLLGGFGYSYGVGGLVRLKPDGTIDEDFSTSAPFDGWSAGRVVRLADGSILAATYASFSPASPALMHFSPTGVYDESFPGENGPFPATQRFGIKPLAGGGYLLFGSFSSVGEVATPKLARMTPTGSVDVSLTVDITAVGVVNVLRPLPSGGMLLGGSFERIDEHEVGNLARIDDMDAVDDAFLQTNGPVSDIVTTSDAKIVALGDFSDVPGSTVPGALRMDADGIVDSTFLAGATVGRPGFTHAAAMADGSVLLTGDFVLYLPDFGRSGILRVMADGTGDSNLALNSSDTALGPAGTISAVAVDNLGRILLSVPGYGQGFTIQGEVRPGIARTLSNGILDTEFAPSIGLSWGADPITPLEDGGFLILGRRDDAESDSLPSLMRFKTDGSIDDGFVLALPPGEYPVTYCRAPDGTLFVVTFSSTQAGSRHLRHFLQSGELDTDFSAQFGVEGAVECMAFDAQDRLWLGGNFTEVDGQPRLGLARFAPPHLFASIEGVSQVIVAAGASHTLHAVTSGVSGTARYQWRRNGVAIAGAGSASLEVSNFDASLAGDYTVVVTDDVATTVSSAVRLRLPEAPTITLQPRSQSASIGGSIVLRVGATGLPEPTYQWYKDGVALAGQTRAELRLRNLSDADAGTYSVQITNAGGTVTSVAARLSIAPLGIDPGFAPAVVRVTDSLPPVLAAGKSDDSLLVADYAGQAVDGNATARLLRLSADGTIDTSFKTSERRFSKPILVQPDGTALVVEEVYDPDTTYTHAYLRRIAADGKIDSVFSAEFTQSYELNGAVVLPDAKVIVWGTFEYVNGARRAQLARLLEDGATDTSYLADVSGTLLSCVVDQEGRATVLFSDGNTATIRRLDVSGTIDPTFAPVTVNAHWRLGMKAFADGSILLYGDFSQVNGTARSRCARILNDGTLAENFTSVPGTWDFGDVGILPDGSVQIVGWSGSVYVDVHFVALDDNGALVMDQSYSGVIYSSSDSMRAVVLPHGGAVLTGALLTLEGRPIPGMVHFEKTGGINRDYRGRQGSCGVVQAVVPLTSGGWLVAGWFTEVAGVERTDVAIIRPDGTVDPDFVPEVPDFSFVTRAFALPDGRVLLAGSFPPFDGNQDRTIVLRSDGSRDTSHDEFLATISRVLSVSRTGKIYYLVPAVPPPAYEGDLIERLNADFTLDATFSPVAVSSGVNQITTLSDGGIFADPVGGDLKDAVGTTKSVLCRIGDDGLIDAAFTPPTVGVASRSMPIETPDGKYMIYGNFSYVNGTARRAVARLNSDGSVDTTFVPPSTGLPEHPGIIALAVESDGKVVLFGRYVGPADLGPNDYVLTRLNTDGSRDTSLEIVMNVFSGTYINAIATRDNGDIVLGGTFVHLGDALRLGLARISPNRFQAYAASARVAVPEGGTGYLSLRTNGATQPTYQWYKDGVALVDATRAALVLRDFSPADVGQYWAEVSTSDGAVVRVEPIEVVLSNAIEARSETPLSFSGTGGLGVIRVEAPTGAEWDVHDIPPWVSVSGDVSSAGSRTISLSAERNLSGASRSATISIAGQTFELSQRAVSGRLVNISTRGKVGTGDNVLIVGFVTAGTQPIDVLSRGVGPTLENFGLSTFLPNPVLTLNQGSSAIGSNDDWDVGAGRDDVFNEGHRVAGFDLKDGAGDAALLSSLAPGAYTGVIRDASGRSGVGLAEFYDRTLAAATDPYNRVVNLSTRGRVGTGNDILIAGFVIGGSTTKEVLIRGVGPSLGAFGVTGYLNDPYIRVVKDATTVAENDDWAYTDTAAATGAAFDHAHAFPLDVESKDAALVLSLEPGAYSVLLSGADGGEGVALVEVYDLEN